MRHIILLLVLISLFFSCKNGGNSSSGPIIEGHRIVVHNSGDGVIANPGDYVFFNFESFDGNGDLWQSFSDAKQQPQVRLPKEGEPNKYLAFIEVLKQVSVGDSLSMFTPRDSMPQIPQSVEGDSIEYRFGITDIMNDEQYEAYKAVEIEKQQQLMEEAKLVSAEKVVDATVMLNNYKEGKFQNIITTDSGLKVVILEQGRGTNANPGSQVSVDYVGMLKDGTKFDDSYSRGAGFDFKVGEGQVIKGWDEGLTHLNLGAKALLEIPYDLAYGERGSPPTIPAKTDLIFVIQVNAIN